MPLSHELVSLGMRDGQQGFDPSLIEGRCVHFDRDPEEKVIGKCKPQGVKVACAGLYEICPADELFSNGRSE